MSTDRALAGLAGEARRLDETIKRMHEIAGSLPLTIRIEVNNLAEVNDLLRHKVREETLRRVIAERPQNQSALLNVSAK